MLRAISNVFNRTTTNEHKSINRTQRYTREQENSIENTTSTNRLVDKKIKNIEHLNNELHTAITTGLEIKKIEELLKQGADPNGFIPHIETYPMKDAIASGRLETVKLLLKYKANIDGHPEILNSMAPYTNLAYAAREKDCDIVKYLLKKGAKPNYQLRSCFYSPLAQASYHNNIDIVKLLIKHGADVNGANYSDDSPLYYFITANKPDNNIIKLLLDHGAKPNYHNGYENLLCVAIRIDNPDILLLLLKYMCEDELKDAKNKMMYAIVNYTSVKSMKALLDHGYSVDNSVKLYIAITKNLGIQKIEEFLKQGADPTEYISSIRTDPMKEAIASGSLETVELFLKYNTNIEIEIEGHPFNPVNFYLSYAVETNHPNIVNLLLKKDAKTNYKVGRYFYNSLAKAANHNNIEIVKLLIKHGADVNGLDNKYPPLYYFINTKKIDNDIIKLLLEHGAKPNYKNGDEHSLCTAIRIDNPDILLLLLKYMREDELKDVKNNMMYTILEYNSVNSMKALLDNGYSVDNNVKLHIAITQDLGIQTIEEFLKQGADPNGYISSISTYPMQDAIASGRLKTVELLLKYNADIEGHPEVLNSDNPYTNLIYAIEKNNTDIVQLLLEKFANPNYKIRNCSEKTPLAQASIHNKIEIAKLLLAYGAKVDGVHDECSPLYYAISKKNKEVSELLLEHGANTIYGVSYKQPLYDVINRGYRDGLSLLLKYTSKDQFKNDMNNIIRPLMNHQGYPMKPHTKKCMKVLFDYGYKIDDYFNFLDNNRYIPMTLLMKAIIAGSDVSFIRILLESNANPNAKYENGITLIEQAIKNDRLYIAFQLRRYGAIADATIISKIIDEYKFDPGITKSLQGIAASTIKKHFENNINDLPIPTDLKRYIKEQKLFIYNDSFIFVD